jgi:WD40 repeat protein
VSYAAYLAELRRKRLGSIDLNQISAEELATRHLASVEDTLADQWSSLVDNCARQLFRMMGLFPEAASVPKVRLGLLGGFEFSDGLVDPLQDAFNELHDLHLMEELEDGAAVRLHPLVWDFAGRLVPASEQSPLRTTAAATLAQLYMAPARLEQHVSARGIDPVIEDLGLALAWSPELPEDGRYLHRLLERERQQIARPGTSLFLQLQHRAACLNLSHLAELYASRGPAFITSVVSRHDDLGWIRSFKGADEEWRTLAISPDGRLALSGWLNLFLWDMGTGRVIRKISKRLGVTDGAAILDDSRHALYSTDETLVFVDLHSGEEIWRGREHQRTIVALALSPDCRWALTGDEDGVTLLWDLQNRSVARRFANPGGEVVALAFHSSGRRFLRTGWTGSLHLYEIDRAEPVRAFVSNPASLQRAAFALDGDHFVSGTNDGRVILWSIDASAPLHTFERYHRHINGIAVSPDGRFALSADDDMSLILWNLEHRDAERRFIGHTGQVHSVAISPDGRTALSGSEDKTLTLWDLSSPQPVHGENHWNRVGAIAFSQDGTRAISGAADGTLILWDENRRCLRRFDSGLKDIAGAALSPDHRYALTGDREGVVILWDLDSFHPLRRFEGLGGASEYPSFSLGRPCVLVSDDRKLTLQALDTGEAVRALAFNEESSLDSFSFLSDGRRALTGTHMRSTGDTMVTLWDLDSSQALRSWKKSLFPLYRAAMVRESQLAVVAGYADLELLDLEALDVVACLYTSASLIALAAHGSTVAVGDYNGTVYFLRV